MKATQLLHRQHQMILQLLNALELERYYRIPLLRELRDQLSQHVTDEVSGFAAQVRSLGPRALAAMRQTHTHADAGLARLMAACHEPEKFVDEVRALRKKLASLIDHEEKELLERAEEQLDDAQLESLGDHIARTSTVDAGELATPEEPNQRISAHHPR